MGTAAAQWLQLRLYFVAAAFVQVLSCDMASADMLLRWCCCCCAGLVVCCRIASWGCSRLHNVAVADAGIALQEHLHSRARSA
jgi:hypothetical protein